MILEHGILPSEVQKTQNLKREFTMEKLSYPQNTP